ncbi:MAG: ankyrin repeat domain-containing protein [Kamptonema sp. SIO1D9]|nr:ankyrin repeat domain-containing protein [Kamptonema sp. SIO1D9]
MSRKSEYSLYQILDLVRDGNLKEIQRIVSLDNSIIQQQDENGTTLLMEASGSGHFELVKFLVEVGSDVNQYNLDGEPSLEYAAREEHWEVFEYLFDLTNQELKESCLFQSAICGEPETLNALIQKQVNVDACRMKGVWCENGFTALIAVIQEGEEGFSEIVETLLDAGADPNLPEEDTGGTPLIYAAKNGSLETIRLLLKAGADPNIENTYGKTALVYAKQKGYTEIVQLLLDAGATEE